MRDLPELSPLRLACAGLLAAFLGAGVLGCGGNSAPATGTESKLSPEVEKANSNMEDFMKNQQKKK